MTVPMHVLAGGLAGRGAGHVTYMLSHRLMEVDALCATHEREPWQWHALR